MKVIVVSGARSNVGKTHLARALEKLLPGAVRVKIGHHAAKPGGDANLYSMGTSFSRITAEHGNANFLIIESNRILEEIIPDCTIYLAADDPKPSARMAEERADIVRGRNVTPSRVSELALRMGCGEETVLKIAELSGALVGEEVTRGERRADSAEGEE